MQNVVLTIHLILAVLLTGVVLLQRSEGGGLGMGGGSGGGVMSGRQAANAMTRLTWIFGIALFVTSISLTIIAARQTSNSSIMDQLGVPESQQGSGQEQSLEYTPPPSGAGDDPLTPPAPATSTVDGDAAEADGAPAALTPPAPEPAATEESATDEAVTPPTENGTTTEPATGGEADGAASENGETAGSENSQQSN
ncbi:preprotein translocase subunit SecG [Paracoccus saliphilus]|uniref:Protein-export membrane protein SecG n=1 Tax=Paracoccus saliphilus TaxID=405559 RepID=A0AA46A4H5_9RHOB|nr:preprotein translocase subunit SecG [Paracoccus saliphilus]WCR01799.1 preprotein translocase subunit SecG [Paracoccus saliphilus]SIS63521.1 protein translocase subunit secG [Paracoccus saliphilus]